MRHASLLQIVDALGAGQISSVELTRQYLREIELTHAELNTYLQVDESGALTAATASDRRRGRGEALHPLDGVPFAVKDNIDVAGLVTTVGLGFRRERIAAADAVTVARLRKAGAVMLGKLHLHEAALGADGDNPHFGRCQNPRRLGYTPGGSSGGSAAAVAAGLCAFSLGSDSLGSIRIPASYCGVVGFKPSFGRVSQRGLIRASRRLDHIGPLVRSAADLPMLFQTISGLDPQDPQSRSVPLVHAEQGAGQWRLGRLTKLSALGVNQGVADVFERRCAAIEANTGRSLQPVDLSDHDFTRSRRAGLLLCEAEMLVEHAADWLQHREGWSPAVQQMLSYAQSRSAADLIGAERQLDASITRLRRVFAEVDLLLLPTTPQTAFAWDTPVPVNQADLTAIANFAGVPALSLPAGNTVDGLPVGLQLMGPVGSDLQLMALAARIEQMA
ncbi:MAG: amidase [Lysobacterales bacterium]